MPIQASGRLSVPKQQKQRRNTAGASCGRPLNTLPPCSVSFHPHSIRTRELPRKRRRPAAEVRGAASKPQTQASFPPHFKHPPFPSSSVSQRHFPRRHCVLRLTSPPLIVPQTHSIDSIALAAASGEGSHGTRLRRP
jgi:hypothetical protein